jgi:6-phosphogluconolactonase
MATEPHVRVCSSSDELARVGAQAFVGSAQESIKLRGRFTVALTGGSTPGPLYRLLADDEGLREAVSWPDVHVFWGDERHVPPTHDDSNFRMAHEALVGRVPIPGHQVHRILAEGPDAEQAAMAYEETLRTAFGLGDGEWPTFDLILLGMGVDGHMASLFPGSPAVRESERLVVGPFVEKLGAHRITMTPPVFVHARETAVLVAGAGKARTLREVLEGPFVPDTYPIQCLRDSAGLVTWLVDAAAASALARR